MAALTSSIASITLLPQVPRVDLGKPVTSVTSLSQIPSRQLQPRQSAFQTSVPRLSALLALAREPDDARITGGTRSLDRRLLALNLSGVVKHISAIPIQN
jgi:hypothetical protein